MTRLGLTVLVGVCALLTQYNVAGVSADHLEHNYKLNKPKGCGCLYNVFANMPMGERTKRACSVSCVYSALNGRCNNICHPEWGEAARPFGRLLKPDYCTAIAPDATRCARSNNPLPSARTLSLELFQDKPVRVLDKFLTSAHMAFGQFLSHDFGRKNEPKATDDKGVNLCGKSQCKVNAVCTPIQVFTGDPDFSASTNCLRFQRSTRNDSPDHECKEQQNDVSSYLDFNTVYGGTMEEMMLVRDVRGQFSAYLNTTQFSQIDLGPRVREGKPLLPQMGNGDCRGKTDKIKCFLAGDKRVKEQPQLTAFHTVFVREHNRIVTALDEVNGGCWSQERLFLEARKINNAQWQYIVYDEYLPLLLSEENLRYWRLKLQHTGYTNSYDKSINATVSNVFMTASFRFGHTQIPDVVPLGLNDFTIFRKPLFSQVFNNPSLVYDINDPRVSAIDAISFGMMGFSAEATDTFFNPEITRSFDAETKQAPARDLEALDIQRGRDHALPGYNAWLVFCGFPKANIFDDFIFIPPNLRTKLSQLYEHVDDVELFVAGVLETPHPGDLTGPIFSCLNAEQFHRTRHGDRFWHEIKRNGFTRAQLQNIRQMTSGKVFCETLDDAHYMQPHVLAHPRSVATQLTNTDSTWDFNLVYNEKLKTDNERVRCSDLPGLDFSLWKETGCWNQNCDHGYPRNK